MTVGTTLQFLYFSRGRGSNKALHKPMGLHVQLGKDNHYYSFTMSAQIYIIKYYIIIYELL